MIWLVASDVHHADYKLKKLLEKETSAQGFIFAGDGIRSVCPYKDNFKEFYAVSGNCDFMREAKQELLIKSEGLNIFLCHGHRYRVKYEMVSLMCRAKELNAQVCVFGHTHSSIAQWKNGILFLNPGALLSDSYAVLTLNKTGQINAQIKQLS